MMGCWAIALPSPEQIVNQSVKVYMHAKCPQRLSTSVEAFETPLKVDFFSNKLAPV